MRDSREFPVALAAGRLFQMAVAECLKARDDRLVRGLVTIKRLRVLDRKLRAG